MLGQEEEAILKLMSAATLLLAALASSPALAHGRSFYSSHASYHGGGYWRGGGYWGGGVGIYLGAPLFWPWYYPPAYYGPPAYYSQPPIVVTSPPLVVSPPPQTTYYPPLAGPGTPGNAVIELPNNQPGQPSQAQQPASPPRGNATLSPQSSNMFAQALSTQLFMYPRQGQSEQQQAKDRDECDRWAMGQIGADPNRSASQLSPTQTSNYYRAMGACLDARSYSVR
jgi:hypothetical protein